VVSDDPDNRTVGNLTGNWSFLDPDAGDTQQANETKWYNNSVEVPELANMTYVGSGNTSKGENWTFSVRVFDGWNWSGWFNSSITIQNTPPSTPVLTLPANNSNISTANVTFIYNATDADGDNLTYYIYINGVLNTSTTLNTTELNFSDGTYSWYVKAGDVEDNSSSSEVRYFTVDTTAPVITNATVSPPVVYPGQNITISANASDPHIDSVWYNISNSSWSVTGEVSGNGSGIYNTSCLSIGEYNVTVYANDTFGNQNSSSPAVFLVRAPLVFNVSTEDYNSSSLITELIVYYPNSTEVIFSGSANGSFSTTLPEYVFDLLYRAFNNSLQVLLRGVNITEENGKELVLDNASVPGYLVTFAINTSYNVSNASLNISYSGSGYTNEDYLGVYRCADWNLTSRSCAGSWVSVSFNQNKAGDYMSLEVTGFSGYSVKQESYCGDGTCDSGETCSSCPADCGSCPTDGNGGGGGVPSTPWKSTYYLTEEQFRQGYTKLLGVLERVRFTVNGTSHYIGVVELTASNVTINITSIIQQAVLGIGETGKFDVDNDSWYDVSVRLEGISGGKANITVISVHEEIVEELPEAPEKVPREEVTFPEPEAPASPEEAPNVSEEVLPEEGVSADFKWVLPVTIVVVMVAVVVFIILFGRFFR